MTWLVEEPVYIGILGFVTLGFLIFAWTQTGYRWMLHAAAGVIALTVGLLVLERLVETEPEQIERTLHQIARDVQTNDLALVLSHVYSGAPETMAMARGEFPRYELSDVDIKRNVEIQLVEGDSPPRAEVSFNVALNVKERKGGMDYGRIPRFVRVTLRKEEGQWKVARYAHEDFQNSLLNLDQ